MDPLAATFSVVIALGASGQPAPDTLVIAARPAPIRRVLVRPARSARPVRQAPLVQGRVAQASIPRALTMPGRQASSARIGARQHCPGAAEGSGFSSSVARRGGPVPASVSVPSWCSTSLCVGPAHRFLASKPSLWHSRPARGPTPWCGSGPSVADCANSQLPGASAPSGAALALLPVGLIRPPQSKTHLFPGLAGVLGLSPQSAPLVALRQAAPSARALGKSMKHRLSPAARVVVAAASAVGRIGPGSYQMATSGCVLGTEVFSCAQSLLRSRSRMQPSAREASTAVNPAPWLLLFRASTPV